MGDPATGQSPASVLSTPVAADATAAPSTDVASTPVGAAATSAAPSSWFDELPDGLKTNPTLQNFKSKSVKDVAESLVNAEKLIGGSLRLPGEKDTPAERQAKLDRAYEQLGRPKSADGYKITPPAGDSGVPWDAARAEAFKPIAHKLNLTQEQVDGLNAWDVQRGLATQVDQTAAVNKCMEELQTKWGAGAKQMLGLSRRTAATYFDQDTLDAVNASGIANNPKFVEALARMGKELMEEGLIVGAREGMSEDGGVSAIQGEIDKTMGNPQHPYFNAQDPNHEAAYTRMASLRAALLELTPTAR